MDEKLEQNRRWWDEAARVHPETAFYDVEGFRRGEERLTPLEVEEMGDVRGKSLLHLQCHFGLDTLALARRGARVTGVDFSPIAIETAKHLAEDLEIPARFVESSVGELPNHLEEEFDVVYTAWGVLAWTPDLSEWARVVARFLRPGGRFHLFEIHPFSQVLDDEAEEPRLLDDYFDRAPRRFENEGVSYAGARWKSAAGHVYEWTHGLGEIVGSLLGAGLRIESLRENPFAVYPAFPWLVRTGGWKWLPPEGSPRIPLSFSLRATR